MKGLKLPDAGNFTYFIIYSMDSLPPKDPPNLTNELARERNRAAAERTLMAWIRTSLSLISFGVGIDGIINAIYATVGGEKNHPIGITRLTGIAFVALGTIAMVAATFEYPKELRRIQRGDFTRTSNLSLGLIVAISLCAIGLVAFIGIVIRVYVSG
jgi:putative membrane protein